MLHADLEDERMDDLTDEDGPLHLRYRHVAGLKPSLTY